jgi:hypothetical protein
MLDCLIIAKNLCAHNETIKDTTIGYQVSDHGTLLLLGILLCTSLI